MSGKASLLQKLNQVEELLIESKKVKKELSRYSPLNRGIRKLIISALLSYLLLGLFTSELKSEHSTFLVVITIIIFTILQKMDSKLKKKSSDKYNEHIKSLRRQKAELDQQLLSLNIAQKYLDFKIIQRFKKYAENNLAESIKECALQYENDLRYEKLQTELNNSLKDQDDMIEELRKANELKSLEIAELKRKINE